MPSEDLILRAQAEDPEEIEQLCLGLPSFIESRARRIHGQKHELVEDTRQETLRKVITKIGSFSADRAAQQDGKTDPPKQFMGWVGVIATNIALDQAKKEARSIPVDYSEQIEIPGPKQLTGVFEDNYFGRPPESPEAIVLAGEPTWLQQAIAGIKNANYRAAVEAVYVRGLTYEQYSLESGVPMGTVSSRIKRGVKEIGQMIKSNQIDPEDSRASAYRNRRSS